jgi:lipopolysaccharide export system protein LptC
LNKLSTFFVAIFLIIIALTSYWLKQEVDREYINKKKDLNSGPDFFLSNFTTTQTDKDGEIKYILKAKEMKHYDYSEKAFLIQPFYTRYENGKPHTSIKSFAGEINNKGDEVFLKKNVVLIRLPTAKKKKMTLFTDELNIFTKLDIVISEKPVKIIQEPDIEIDGIGMSYDKKEGTIKLLSNVKVYYEKPQSN